MRCCAGTEEQALIRCRAYSFSQKLKEVGDRLEMAKSEEDKKSLAAEKKKLNEDRGKMYAEEGKKASTRSTDEKKAFAAANTAIYKAGYGKYCTEDIASSDELCTNPLMKKIYGPKKAAPA